MPTDRERGRQTKLRNRGKDGYGRSQAASSATPSGSPSRRRRQRQVATSLRLLPIRRQPDIRGNFIHARLSAAVDDDRHLRAEPAFETGSHDGGADVLGERRRVGDFVRIEPGQGPGLTGTPVRTAMPSASTSAARSAADAAVSPRICRLPRAVTSTTPLPCRSAALHSPIKALGERPPATGLRRTSSPSPVCIGADSAGHGAAAREAAGPYPPPCRQRVHAATCSACASAIKRGEIVVDRVAQRVPQPAPARRGKTLGDELCRRRVLAQHESAHGFVAEIGVVHGLDQRAGDRIGGFGEADQPVDRLGEFGCAARAVPHLAGDETRVGGAGANHAARPLP